MNSTRQTPILVVEDDEDDSFFLTHQLEMAHIDDCVTIVSSGQEAFDFLMETETLPRVIFLDLNLPGLSGIQLLEKIRKQPRLESLPVIIISGSINPNDVTECTRLGVTAYLPKPVDLTTFIAIARPQSLK